MLPLVFTRAEALASGLTSQQVDAAVRSGLYTALRRGVYAETALLPDGAPERHAAEVAAAARTTALDVVGSHESAALVHDLTTFAAHHGPPVLTRHRDSGARRPDGTPSALLAAHVPLHHRATLHGAAVTSLARTAVDLARKGPALSAVVAVDAALRRGVSRGELEEVLRVAKGWPGTRPASRYVEFGDGRAESALESVGRWRMHEIGMPTPQLQLPVHDHVGLIGRVDFAFEEQRVIGEADGLQKYLLLDDGEASLGNPLALEKLREDRLRDAEWEIFRFTWAIAVHRPRELERRARNAFRRAAERRLRAA